jgi:hypothetical protein
MEKYELLSLELVHADLILFTQKMLASFFKSLSKEENRVLPAFCV